MPTVGQELDLNCYRVRDAGQRAYNQVLPAITDSPIRATAYTIKGRVKTKPDIYEKVLRKREEPDKQNYEPQTMTDVAGIRIVTLFQPDLVDAVSHLLKMIKQDESVTVRPFIKDELREVLVFTNTSRKNPLSVTNQIIEVVRAAGFENALKDPMESESGYSSVHLIVQAMAETEYATGKSKLMPFPVEIQVRTVFEDAWGEVDHKLRYRDRRKSDTTPLDERLMTWLPHLNALKTYVDGCTQYADIIKRQAIDFSPRARRFLPIESTQDALAEFSDCSEELKHKLRQAYSARERMTDASAAEDRIRFAAETVEEFERIEKEEQTFLTEDSEQARRLRYYLRMEQAFAHMQRRDEAEVDSTALQISISLYEKIADEFNTDPVVFYRWGLALAFANKHAEAIPQFKRASEVLTVQWGKHWLCSAIPRNLAMAYWRLSEVEQDNGKRLALLKDAHDLTEGALDKCDPGSRQETHVLNSMIYYAVEYMMFNAPGAAQPFQVDLFAKYVERVAATLQVATSNELRKLDTLCRAYAYLERPSNAGPVANRIVALLEKMDPERLSHDERDMLKFAREVLAFVAEGSDRLWERLIGLRR